jgi:hypothetical protein
MRDWAVRGDWPPAIFCPMRMPGGRVKYFFLRLVPTRATVPTVSNFVTETAQKVVSLIEVVVKPD